MKENLTEILNPSTDASYSNPELKPPCMAIEASEWLGWMRTRVSGEGVARQSQHFHKLLSCFVEIQAALDGCGRGAEDFSLKSAGLASPRAQVSGTAEPKPLLSTGDGSSHLKLLRKC